MLLAPDSRTKSSESHGAGSEVQEVGEERGGEERKMGREAGRVRAEE